MLQRALPIALRVTLLAFTLSLLLMVLLANATVIFIRLAIRMAHLTPRESFDLALTIRPRRGKVGT